MKCIRDRFLYGFQPRGNCEFIGTALALGLGLASAAASAGSSMYGASQQAGAAQDAASLNYKAQQDALAFQKQQWETNQANQAPWLHAGQGAVTELSALMNSGGFPAWSQTFQAPTAEQAAQTPGYQFQLQQGQEALQRSAAAKGGLLTGGTLKALDAYSQGLASSNYQQVYNNAFQQYQQKYGEFNQNQANLYNRLAGLSGTGQVAAGSLGAQGQQAAQNMGNIYQSGAQAIGNNLQNAAYQTASGYNAAAGALGNLGQYGMLYNMMNGGGNNWSAGYNVPGYG